jgi:hypothetical protein
MLMVAVDWVLASAVAARMTSIPFRCVGRQGVDEEPSQGAFAIDQVLGVAATETAHAPSPRRPEAPVTVAPGGRFNTSNVGIAVFHDLVVIERTI